MIAIVDYGVGNLFSLVCSFQAIGVEAKLTKDKTEIQQAEKIILPGVGAFGDASERLFSSGLAEVVIEEAEEVLDEFNAVGILLVLEEAVELILMYYLLEIGYQKTRNVTRFLASLARKDCVYIYQHLFAHMFRGI